MNNFGDKVSFIWSVADLLLGVSFYNTSRYTFEKLRGDLENIADMLSEVSR